MYHIFIASLDVHSISLKTQSKVNVQSFWSFGFFVYPFLKFHHFIIFHTDLFLIDISWSKSFFLEFIIILTLISLYTSWLCANIRMCIKWIEKQNFDRVQNVVGLTKVDKFENHFKEKFENHFIEMFE